MRPLLEVEGVTKKFGGLVALNNVSFTLNHGEIVALVGPNGSGKTTMFNLINGVYKPEEGRVIFESRDITKVPAYDRARMGIGRTFQIPRPFKGATVEENVAVGALFGSMSDKVDVEEALEIARETLQIVGLYEKRNEEAGKLTVPEKRFLELARGLAMKPKLLLLDEVVAGMPPNTIDHLMDLVKELKVKENIAIVALVEHMMRAVARIAERTIVLHQGEKILEGPAMEVLRNPRLSEIYLGKIVKI